jgi:CheY-like chemotaxis protein
VSKIVLCVDDSATIQMVADITFRGTEFQYVGARSVDEGLQKAKAQKPAVVLADSQMSGKSGYDLALALKSDPATADVPVVILVGNSAPYDAAKGTSSGVDANLPKPWDTQTMLEKVTEIVGKGAVAKPGSAAAPTAATPAAAAPAAASKSAPVAPAGVAQQPPRSSTIMGMPTIKMPAGVAPTVTAVPAKTQAMAVPPMAPAPATTTPGAGAGLRPPASPAASAAPAVSMPSAAPAAIGGMNRSPMVSGTPTKRSALVERTLAKMAGRLAEAAGIEPGSPELLALLKLSTEVVERIVWEVVPDLAEQIIRENLAELTKQRS